MLVGTSALPDPRTAARLGGGWMLAELVGRELDLCSYFKNRLLTLPSFPVLVGPGMPLHCVHLT